MIPVDVIASYQTILGYPIESVGPWFDHAEREIRSHVWRAIYPVAGRLSVGRWAWNVNVATNGRCRSIEIVIDTSAILSGMCSVLSIKNSVEPTGMGSS